MAQLFWQAACTGAAIAVLAACAPSGGPGKPSDAAETAPVETAETAPAAVAGSVDIPAGATLPDDAVLKVELRAPQDGATTAVTPPLAAETFPVAGAPPYAFEIALPEGVAEDSPLVVSARIQSGYAILFNNLSGVPVSDDGTPVAISLVSTDMMGSAGGPVAVTPVPKPYECGGTAVAIAIETGAAYVTLDGGAVQQLDLLVGTPGNARQYSNGKLVVQVERDEYGAEAISFARGRAAPLPCTQPSPDP